MFTLPSTQKSTLKSIVNLISLKLKLELTDPLYCEPSMQNHVYNAIKMRGYTMRTGHFTRCYICSFLCVLRARLEQTNYLMITQGGKKQRKSISLESWDTASRITTDYLSNWRCVPTITALWPSLDQPSLLQHPTKCTSDYRKISWPTVTNWPADKHRSGNKQATMLRNTQSSDALFGARFFVSNKCAEGFYF